MRPNTTHDHRCPAASDGFTLIELAVAMMVLAIVMTLIASTLFSLSTTASRNDELVSQEQSASNALAQLNRDIRSAQSVIVSTSTYQTQLELVENLPNQGGTTYVQWVYSSTATPATLARQVSTDGSTWKYSGSGISGGFTASASDACAGSACLRGVDNAAAAQAGLCSGSCPIFSYYDENGNSLSSNPSQIQTCTTRVDVDIWIKPRRSGLTDLEEKDSVAVTDQLSNIVQKQLQGTSTC